MKKIFTISILSLFILSFNLSFYAQSQSKDYASKKLEFYKMYEIYKYNVEHNIFSIKPIDPNGIFTIDEQGNMVDISSQIIGSNQIGSTAPWINGYGRDNATNYSFSQNISTYVPISGGTVIATGAIDDTPYPQNYIGFVFHYNGIAYDSVGVDANGYIWFTHTGANPTTSDRLPISQVVAYNGAISALGQDLIGLSAGEIRIQTQGSAPNRYCTIQFANWAFYSVTTDSLNFQFILYETSDSVNIKYGKFVKDATSRTAQVGMRGATNADFVNRTTTTNWSATTAGTLNTDACTATTAIYPPNGLTFTYKPPPTGPMGYASSNTVQVNTTVILAQSTVNNPVLQVQVADTGITSPLIINRIKFETTGSNNPGTDIAFAKLYYTRSSSTFSITRQFGSSVAAPNGVFNFQGDTASLDPNTTNYFWLTYDISGSAVLFDSVDAQCDSIFGSSPMNGVVPTVIAPAGASQIDNYCRGQVSNAGCNYNIYISNVNMGSISNPSACNGNMPFVFTNYTNLSTVVRQSNQYGITVSIPSYANATAFGIWVDWNNNNSFGDAGEYFATSVISSSTTNPASGTIIAPPGATIGNHRMRIRANLSSAPGAANYCATLSYGEQEDYTLVVRADTSMTYMSSTTTQSSVAPIYTPATNTQIIGMQVVTDGTISPLAATSFSLNTTGTSHPSQDITNAKIYWTGTSPVFSTANLVGVTLSPVGTYSITGNQTLAQGTNYFWLTYDVPVSAPTGDTVDAQCTSITVGGVARTPTVTSPAGFRIISGSSLCGTYTIPGSYPTIAAAITDLNAKGTPTCNIIYNVAAGYTETAANLTITTTGTPTSTITFRKYGTGDNPKIRAAAGTGTYDGVIKLYGVNYITFDGIDVSDTSTNTTTTTQMEWGYALLRPDGTHGCQYNTIINCNIILNKTNTATFGIFAKNINTTGTTQTPTIPAGTNSYNNFLSNNISNCYGGITVYSYSDGTFPFSLGDHNNTVSNSPSGPSSITNFGGTATTAYGIYAYYQSGFTCTNTSINSRGGINSTGYLYGIYNYHYYDNGDATISGDSITLVDTTSSTAYQYAIYNYGYYANNDIITNNVIQNCVNPCLSGYYNYYIYNYCASGSPLYRNNITIAGNKIINNSIGVVSTGYGYEYHIYNYGYVNNTINISNNLDSNNQNLGTTGYTQYVLYNPGIANNMVINKNRFVNNVFGGLTAASTSYGMYCLGTSYLSCQIDSNTFANNSLPSTSSHSMYFMYISCVSPNMDVSMNNISGNTGAGSGSFYSMYYSATPAYASIENVSNNTITNQSKTTATGTGTIYGLYKTGSSPGTVNVNNNIITGFSSAAATTFYGLYQAGAPPNILNINNNKIGNFTTAGAGIIYGLYNGATTTTIPVISNDSIFNLNSAGGTIYGMYTVNGNPVTITGNKILGIYTTSGTAYGLYIGGGTINYVYNNFISDINATTSTTYTTPAATGIYITGGTYDYIYYNTIYMKDSSTSATSFGTAGIYASTAYNVDFRNNVVCNYSYPGPTLGNTVAYWRSANSLPTYLNSSNNNCFYAGTPAANRLIYYDGTNSIQTLAAYKTFVLPRDNNSATELPPFVNIATKPYDLRIQTSAGTQLESGGQVISTTGFPPALLNITQDAYGTARFPNSGYPVGSYTPTAPDMGAYEFGGINSDAVPPFISYTALGIGGTSNRAFNNVVITDASGINTTTNKPRCYYKRSTDGNVINDNTNTTDGWKYVQSNGTTTPFDFTIDYSLLNGGTGVASGNVVQYFVIAQDLATTPNVGSNQATFTVAPTIDTLVSANAPITNTLSYTINTNSFSGAYNVGTAQTYTSLTGAAGIFGAINAGTVSGNITINITSDMVEDGTNQLNALNETGPGNYKVTIVPGSASMKTIQGSVSQAMIRLNGVRNVTIDGNNGLGAKYLTFRNYYGTTPTLQFQNETRLDTIKNCTLESNNIGTASGTVYFSTTTNALGLGNDSNCINSCDIRDRSDVAGMPCNAIYASGSTTTLNTYNNYCSIINNNIYNNFYDAGTFTCGMYMNAGNSNWTISGNSFYQTTARSVPANSSSMLGIYIASSLDNDYTISNNYFGGSAPLCGSSPLTVSGAGAFTYYAMYLANGYLSPVSVQGNTIQNFALTYSGASTMNFFRAIYVSGSTSWVNIGNLSGNTIGAGTGTGSITLTINTTASAFTIPMIQDFGFGTIMNNTFGSITFAGNATSSGGDLYAAIYWSNTQAGQIYTISNNLIGSLSTPNSIQMTNLVNYHTFRGAYVINGAGTTNNFTNNTIANITSFGTTALYLDNIYGYWYATASQSIVNVTGNTIRNLTNNNNVLSASFGLEGIIVSGYGVNTITNNNIYSLYSNGTTGAELVGGISAAGYNGGTIAQNKIYDFRIAGTGLLAPAPLILGINPQGNPLYTITNNMISLTNGDASENMPAPNPKETFEQVVVKNPPVNLDAVPKDGKKVENVTTNIPSWGASEETNAPFYKWNVAPTKKTENQTIKHIEKKGDGPNSTVSCTMAGVYFTANNFRGPCNFYYNTIYIGGSSPGALNSWDFIRTANGQVSILNNLFINNRTGGNNYCVSNEGSLTEGWGFKACNYNAYINTSDATIGEWGLGNAYALNSWTVNSNGDFQSWESNTGNINPLNLITNLSTCDLRIVSGNSSAWIVSGKGIAISGQGTDYEGTVRSASISTGTTDIGADEFTATPPSNPVASQVGTPGAGASTSYVLYGRTLCTINWGAGGTSYPTNMTLNYYSGFTPPNATSLAPTYSSSYWTLAPVGNLAGTTYDITFYYGDNETYTINSPAANCILTNRNATFWQAFPYGQNALQSNLNSSTNIFNVLGQNMISFTTYALTDGSVVPALTYPAHNSVNMPTTDTLKWATVSGATLYRVQLSTDSLFGTTVIDDSTVTSNSRIVTGLSNLQKYFWRVRAKIPAIVSPFAAGYKFTTASGVAYLGLKVIPGGFYSSSAGTLNMKDTVRVLLVDGSCNKVDSTKAIIDSVSFAATSTLAFSLAPTGNYYIYVYHRNHITISSANTVAITRGSTVNYDFTTDSSKTYGMNVTKVSTSPVLWGMLPGDANQDGYVDGLDQTIWVAQNGLNGFFTADFNGDTYVDGLDQTLWVLFNGSSYSLPCSFNTVSPGVHQTKVIQGNNNKTNVFWNVLPQNNTTKNELNKQKNINK